MKRLNNTMTTQNTSWMIRIAFMLMIAATLVLTGCDSEPTEVEDYDPEPLLTAFISNGVPVEEVLLESVGDFEAYYSPELFGIDNARVILFPVIDQNGADVDTSTLPADTVLTFSHDNERPGRYIPNHEYIIQGKVRYRIEVTRDQDETFGDVDLWAETTVPDTFSWTAYKGNLFTPYPAVNGDTLRRTDEEILLTWTDAFDNVDYEGARQGGYALGIKALTPKEDLENLDPDWDPDDPDNDDPAEEDLARWGWTVAPDYQKMLTIAWFYFEWVGWHEMQISAASVEYYSYLFSLWDFGNNNPEFNVHGGLGIFGATTRHTFRIYLEKVEPEN